MKLSEYINEETSVADFAALIGVTRQTVYIWLGGKAYPTRRSMKRIVEATDGAVTANDFF